MKRSKVRARKVSTVSAIAWTLALAVGAVVGACADGEVRTTFDDASDASADAPEPRPQIAADGGLLGEGGVLRPECAEATKLIYVLGSDRALYRFELPDYRFTRIGTLDCPTVSGTFSMAIDRRGVAWVEFMDGRLFAVDTANARCEPTAFVAGQTGFRTFGMGFARNDDDAGETLYVAGAGLGKLDTSTLQLTFLGSLSLGRTELTGMDKELFAFSIGTGIVAGLDKTNATSKVTYRTSATEAESAFAFAHWGGDFWLFTGTGTSKVTRYSPTTDVSTVVMENTGMLIVGAGSSTCAPTTPPR